MIQPTGSMTQHSWFPSFLYYLYSPIRCNYFQLFNRDHYCSSSPSSRTEYFNTNNKATAWTVSYLSETNTTHSPLTVTLALKRSGNVCISTLYSDKSPQKWKFPLAFLLHVCLRTILIYVSRDLRKWPRQITIRVWSALPIHIFKTCMDRFNSLWETCAN